VPEVVVKVSGGARTLAGVERHLQYIEKKGVSGLETDMETRAGGKGFAGDLVRDWDLDVEALKHYSKKTIGGRPPKLVHNLIFSMPAGTSPEAVLGAVRKLALNQWELQHRYAMALHTDTPRPHVHVALKAVSEQGVRLNIRKATLRDWRAQFAESLRALGVAANATERAVRGEARTNKRSGIYRADMRDESTYIRKLEAAAVEESRTKTILQDPGHVVMTRTRQFVTASWRAVSAHLRDTGDLRLAGEVDDFVGRMVPVQTERSMLAERLCSNAHNHGLE